MKAPQLYEIRIEGRVGNFWSSWFEGLSCRYEGDGGGGPIRTVLSGQLDQAALHGVLIKVRDLGLELIAVNCLELD